MLVFAAAPTFLGCRERGRPLVAVRGLPIVGPLVAEHRLRGAWTSVAAVLGLWSTDSGAGAHGLRCSAACGVLPARGSSPWLLPWQVDSLPLQHLGLLPSKLHQILVTSGGRKGEEKIRTLIPLQRTWLMRCVNYQWKDGPCTRRTGVTPLPTEEEQGIEHQMAEVFPTREPGEH